MMIDRKIFVLAMFIIALVTISAVSAADTQTVDLETDDVQAIESENDEILSEGNDAGTFTDLRNNISAAGDNNILTLDRNFESDGTGHIDFSNSNLTIDGQGYTIDAKNQTEIFIVRGSNVTIKNITFTNSQGGAISWYGADGKITDCNFINTTGDSAIYWGASGGSVSGSSFINNTEEEGSGGAIFWNDAGGSVSGCSFIGNTAHDGGAIFWNDADGSVSGCSFIGNTANIYGGAIYWNKDGGSVSGCSFIGNTANISGGAIYIPTIRYLPADYCWFGNDASNYNDSLPIGGPVNCTYRLFLNFTVNPDNIPLFGTSDIAFKLFLYNSTSGNTSDYDNSLFEYLNLTITPNNGNVDKSVAKMGDTIKYTGTSAGKNNITVSIENITVATVNVDVDKGNLTLTVSCDPIIFGENATIIVNGFANATGTATAYVGDGIYFAEIKNGNATFNVPGVITNATAEIKYLGDNNYNNASTSILVVVKPAPTNIESAPVTATYNDDGYLVATLKDINTNPISGVNLTVSLNGAAENYTTDLNGTVRIPLKGMAAGNYTAEITFAGNNNYIQSNSSVNVTITKAASNISSKGLTTTYHDYKYLIVNLNDDNGNPITNVKANITINGVTYNCPVDENGNAELIIRLNPGTYETAVTLDNGNYNTTTITTQVVVKKATPKLTAKKKTFKKALKTKKYTVVLKDNLAKAVKNVKLTLKIKGKTYTARTNSKGKSTFKITKLNKKGTFKAVIKYNGNRYFNKVSKKAKIIIK